MVDAHLPSMTVLCLTDQGTLKEHELRVELEPGHVAVLLRDEGADITYSNEGGPIGVEFVVLDATGPTAGFTPTGRATQIIYVGVAPVYKGLSGLSLYPYKSTHGGATWTRIDGHRYGGSWPAGEWSTATEARAACGTRACSISWR